VDSKLCYYGMKRRFRGIELGLMGGFQSRNAALALTTIEVLERKGFRISSQDIIQGLKVVNWPGRMHAVSTQPLIILDGAHNPKAARELALAVENSFSYRRLILVMGVMEDKDIGKILASIVPMADYVIYTRPVYFRSAAPQAMKKEAEVLGIPGETQPAIPSALDRAKGLAGPEDMILVTGSLFTVGEALTYFDSEEYRPDEI